MIAEIPALSSEEGAGVVGDESMTAGEGGEKSASEGDKSAGEGEGGGSFEAGSNTDAGPCTGPAMDTAADETGAVAVAGEKRKREFAGELTSAELFALAKIRKEEEEAAKLVELASDRDAIKGEIEDLKRSLEAASAAVATAKAEVARIGKIIEAKQDQVSGINKQMRAVEARKGEGGEWEAAESNRNNSSSSSSRGLATIKLEKLEKQAGSHPQKGNSKVKGEPFFVFEDDKDAYDPQFVPPDRRSGGAPSGPKPGLGSLVRLCSAPNLDHYHGVVTEVHSGSHLSITWFVISGPRGGELQRGGMRNRLLGQTGGGDLPQVGTLRSCVCVVDQRACRRTQHAQDDWAEAVAFRQQGKGKAGR